MSLKQGPVLTECCSSFLGLQLSRLQVFGVGLQGPVTPSEEVLGAPGAVDPKPNRFVCSAGFRHRTESR